MNNNLFIKYYDNQLTDQEKAEFEARLKNDQDFKQAYDEFLASQQKLKNLANIQINNDYFITLPVRINNRISANNKKLKIIKPAIAFSFTVVIVFFISLYYFNVSPEKIITPNKTNSFIAESISTSQPQEQQNIASNISINSNNESKSTTYTKNEKIVTYSALENDDVELAEEDVDDFINNYQSVKIINIGK